MVGEAVGDVVGDAEMKTQSELHCLNSTPLHLTLCGVPTVHEVQTDAIVVPSTQLFVHVSGFPVSHLKSNCNSQQTHGRMG